MSATALEIITRAGKRSKILADEAAFSASEGVDALQLLNDMLHGFGPKGIAYAHTTLASSDTLNVPDEQVRNVVLMLTQEFCIDYEMPIGAALGIEIMNARNELQAAYHVQAPAEPEPMLRNRRLGRFDITRLD